MAVVALLLFTAWVAVTAVGWIGSAQLARSVADSAALAGAEARSRGGNACTEARAVAASNGGQVVECRVIGDEVSFVVRVGVEVPLLPAWRIGPKVIRGDATAGSQP